MELARRLEVFADYGLPELPEKVVKAFSELGDDQRGKPEFAMLVVQRIMGGGVLNPVVEHVGDITHRMSHMVKYVHVEGREKILKTLKWLTHPYGFEKELQGNIISNAKYNDMTPKELQDKLTEALTAYANAHAKLKVYNRAQWLARQAAIDIGRQKFDGARLCLTQLKAMAPDDETFAKHAMEYKLAADGEPIQYPYKSVEARLIIFASLGEIYHATNIADALKILADKRFKLSTTIGTKSDQAKDSKYAYFLSLTRSKLGNYHIGNQQGAMLVLDPDYLASYGKLGPIDYWGPEFRKIDPKRNEMEERLWGNKQFIPLPNPPSKLIKAIHVLYQLDDGWEGRFRFKIRQLWLSAKQLGIKFYFYNNPKDWLLQRTDKAIPLKQAASQLTGPEVFPSGNRTDWTKEWRELYYTKNKNNLSSRANRILRSLNYYSQEAETQLMSELHNARTDSRVGKLVNLIQKQGGVKKFLQFLTDKFTKMEK